MLFKLFFALSFSTLGLITQSFSQFDEAETFLPVEQAYQLSGFFNQDHSLQLQWQIAPKYYLYKHSFKFDLTDQGQALAISADIEPGLAKTDEFFGDVEVYYHSSAVTLTDIPKTGNYQLTVTSQGCADAGLCYPPRKQIFTINADQQSIDETLITQQNPLSNSAAIPPSAASKGNESSHISLLYAILFAMLGGAILNLMPCVFPVLSLKILSFTKDKEHNHSLHGLSYSAGVIVSFVAVAATLISLQAAGEAVGWGFQLQSPWFVAALAYLFFVMGLSLSGAIELGQSWMGAGSQLAAKQGYSGSFFSGVLATVVASPCTAPFMGTALGYAITQDALTALLVFAALGLGMALPVLIMAHSPKLLNKLPKPGPWMEQLKQFLAFPLYATTLWLCWVIGKQTGVTGMLLVLIGCLLIALALWLWQQHWLRKLLSLSCLAAAVWLIGSPMLSPSSEQTNEQEWQAYSPELLSQLRQQQQLIFVNLTADWCITCLANEKITLSTEEVKASFKANNVNYLKGDWTNHDPAISALLKEHGRTGIPLYLLYPPSANSRAIILPQILSKSLLLEQISLYSQQN
ncbi:protein-disulfide reductase DsbD [Dasania sp. GY-MA-18]|uniref:Protein-disulfide reductase DsbD n=1 Tax=Dasania phycosphaerae TaxID=2950436 RepID=A0A9J6RL29_9GAMM|nr:MULTISPECIES: protein-disulfide reductase DsbD [Dasania]MCR8922991.1 protein-disulfide reductase DsbD [Dasania sp. GY-MA-18]MCZ0865422.1 protein-disulfide reductase DsbD [Dasania phycosphaerae]MCZ0869147.1 protein-disulfide reductase DsbD [Dasania phycosphaerae]